MYFYVDYQWTFINLKNTIYNDTKKNPMKYLGINIINYVEYLYAINYSTIVNKIKEGLNKWIYVCG